MLLYIRGEALFPRGKLRTLEVYAACDEAPVVARCDYNRAAVFRGLWQLLGNRSPKDREEPELDTGSLLCEPNQRANNSMIVSCVPSVMPSGSSSDPTNWP